MMVSPFIEKQAIKALFRLEFIAEMRKNCVNGHYRLLPSEAARVVGERWGVDPETVLEAFLP